MKTTTLKIVTLTLLLGGIFAATGAGVYHAGRNRGFDQGWDKGYIRGLENPQNSDAYQQAYQEGLKDSTCGANTSKDPDEVCINHQCEAEQD
jgi:hypothetical protein